MPPRNRQKKCQICTINDSKYTCSGCTTVYCSVPCYKKHKEVPCAPERVEQVDATEDSHMGPQPEEEPLSDDAPPLRPLTSLKWPYVPEESAYPDPLKRDDPKPLQTRQYEAIATSTAIRKTLEAHPNLPALLTNIDKLRGPEREGALQRALGVSAPNLTSNTSNAELSQDVLALRALAEAVEGAVRGGREAALGLDWGE
ncbi:hypothetical protein FB45DRAFT_908045 [Roridomyces roridus]|uniref:HIT-type domain-containing protein n=1 Tax=Roridomyces roridus TaxID=1738132 RepID=A0AAD7C2A0_9AGAR|nr:hypothetical protein FB45DRAFT_908045 [Roridomyces roridus]